MNKFIVLASALMLSVSAQANEAQQFCRQMAESSTSSLYMMWRANMDRAEIRRAFSAELRHRPDLQEVMTTIIDGTYLMYHRGIDEKSAAQRILDNCHKF